MTQRRITIVGAGQSGLQLGLGLLRNGYAVRMISNRTPEEIATGRVASSQCMFDAALQHERDVGVPVWDDAPTVDGIGFTVPSPDVAGVPLFSWAGRLDAPAQSIDQRVKYPVLMGLFVEQGGEMVYEDAGIAELERYAAEDELVLVAAGKGEIARLFERDAERSRYAAPQRALALTYVTGLEPRPEFSAVCFNLIPGIGEYFVFPALTTTGPCEIMVFEGVPGGPMDSWSGLSPEAHLENSLDILRTFLPWEADRAHSVALTDDNGILQGRFPPTIRRPVATLPSGRQVLGMADVVVLNDPITGQGSNNAAKCAAAYLAAILDQSDGAYDRAFMQAAFERYYAYAKHVAHWTNTMLAPPEPHMLQLLGAASEIPEIATRFANGFNDPRDFNEWFLDPEKASEYLAAAGSRSVATA